MVLRVWEARKTLRCWCCWCFYPQRFSIVYTVRVIHTVFRLNKPHFFVSHPRYSLFNLSPSLQTPLIPQNAFHKIFNITNPILFSVNAERKRRGVWENVIHSDMEKSWKRFSWYDEVNYFIFMLFFPLSRFTVFIILLPFASAYARVGNVMMFCMLSCGRFTNGVRENNFFSPLPFVVGNGWRINLYSFYYTRGSRM